MSTQTVPSSLLAALAEPESVRPAQRSPFIVSKTFDALFFLGSPIWALLLGASLHFTELGSVSWTHNDTELTISGTLLGVLIHAHLFLVFFRSHGNPAIRKLYPVRFFVVPPLLLIGMLSSVWVLVSVSVLATFWDVYHSGLQTFGLSRIYEARAGNHPAAARRLDVILNHLLYAGPILGGATMIDHFEDFEEFEGAGTTFFNAVPAFMTSNQRYFAWGLLFFGAAFLTYYVYVYLSLLLGGHKVSVPKLVLLVSTGACSIYTWGFNSFGEAFFIMNLFHAVQYFALVWVQEKKNLGRLFRLESLTAKGPLSLLVLVGTGAAYGSLVELTPSDIPIIYPLSLMVSILHFWYDGFVWSVRKQQV